MATAQSIIGKSMRLIGVLASGDTGTATEYADGLESLNSVIDGMSVDPRFYFTEQDEAFTLVVGQSGYCIGNSSLLITSLSAAGTTATAVCATPHGLETGNKVTVSGATPAAFNVTAVATVVNPTTFTYPIASTTATATGTIVVTAGDFNTVRPIHILGAFTRLAGVDTPIGLISEQYWTNLQDKTTTGTTPTKLIYRPNAPFGQIIVYPIPTGTPVLHLKSEKIISQFADLTTNYLLPQGYLRLLHLALAVELCSEYRSKVDEAVASNTKAIYETMLAGIPAFKEGTK